MKRFSQSAFAESPRRIAPVKLTDCSTCILPSGRRKVRPFAMKPKNFCCECLIAKSPAAPPPYH
jgi:hypothetical protein